MAGSTDIEDSKVDVYHIESMSTSGSMKQEMIDDQNLDTIEETQSGKYAWLVATTAGVGGLLFGKQDPF